MPKPKPLSQDTISAFAELNELSNYTPNEEKEIREEKEEIKRVVEDFFINYINATSNGSSVQHSKEHHNSNKVNRKPIRKKFDSPFSPIKEESEELTSPLKTKTPPTISEAKVPSSHIVASEKKHDHNDIILKIAIQVIKRNEPSNKKPSNKVALVRKQTGEKNRLAARNYKHNNIF